MRALAALLLIGAALPAATLPAAAQQPGAENAERAARKADTRAAEIREDADAADRKARAARQQAINLARRIQDGEARASAIEARMARIEGLRRQQRARLASQQGEISRLLAVLQTLSRRPAGLVLLEPNTAVTTARVSALLESIQPVLRARTAHFRAELARTRRLQSRLAESRQQLMAANTDLAAAIRQLDALQQDLRKTRDSLDREADAERARARELAARAIDLRGLAGAIEKDSIASRRLAAARPARRGTAASLPFAYVQPATGSIVQSFGQPSGVGVRARGTTFATRPGAQVVSPADGRIAYSGPFRTYGDIVIVQHPGALLSMMSGLERVDVLVGEPVKAGTPIGRMGSLSPELYLELRKEGRPIDPALHVTTRVAGR